MPRKAKIQPIVFEDAHLQGIEFRRRTNVVMSFQGRFSYEIAERLDASDLVYTENRKGEWAEPKSNWDDPLKIKCSIAQPRLLIKPEGLPSHHLDMDVDKVSKFQVKRLEKGGLSCSFEARMSGGNPFKLVEYWMSAGEAPGPVEIRVGDDSQITIGEAIEKEQMSLEAGASKKGSASKNGKTAEKRAPTKPKK